MAQRNRATLPTDAKERKEYPIATGVLFYFPDAIAEIAHVSFQGNQQHNPGQPLHWAREKSTDQEDTLVRHLLESGTRDKDGLRHTAKLAWRALAMLQLEIEADLEKERKVELVKRLLENGLEAAARAADDADGALFAEGFRKEALDDAYGVKDGRHLGSKL